MNAISIIFPYYKNPRMLEYQMTFWQKYPKEVEVILVDDGSPIGFRAEDIIAKFPKLQCKFKLFRIMADIAWNEGQARNLGAKFAANEWIVLVDMDHIVTVPTLNALIVSVLDTNTVYTFNRLEHFSRETNTAHKESRLMTRDLYWTVGGYDESYSGHYSFYCTDWRSRLDVHPQSLLPLALERVDRSNIPDCNSVGLIRKEGRDEAFWNDVKLWKSANGIGIELLKLPWKLVMQQD
ncbi:MAG TPA: glycosyltransferase family 2 protein [Terriglobales bacterium]|nr:glycosyltransferase family 2 protein [Terriglobales bacterium]